MEDSDKKFVVDSKEKATPFGSGWLFFNRRLMGKFSSLGSWILLFIGIAAIVTVVVLLLTGTIGSGEEVASALRAL